MAFGAGGCRLDGFGLNQPAIFRFQPRRPKGPRITLGVRPERQLVERNVGQVDTRLDGLWAQPFGGEHQTDAGQQAEGEPGGVLLELAFHACGSLSVVCAWRQWRSSKWASRPMLARQAAHKCRKVKRSVVSKLQNQMTPPR